jgi:hypothetical protein
MFFQPMIKKHGMTTTLTLPTCGTQANFYAPYSATLRKLYQEKNQSRFSFYQKEGVCPQTAPGMTGADPVTGQAQLLEATCTEYLQTHTAERVPIGCHVCESVVAPIVFKEMGLAALLSSDTAVTLPTAETLNTWLYGAKRVDLIGIITTFMALPTCQRWRITERVCNQDAEVTPRTFTVQLGTTPSVPGPTSSSQTTPSTLWYLFFLLLLIPVVLGIMLWRRRKNSTLTTQIYPQSKNLLQ